MSLPVRDGLLAQLRHAIDMANWLCNTSPREPAQRRHHRGGGPGPLAAPATSYPSRPIAAGPTKPPDARHDRVRRWSARSATPRSGARGATTCRCPSTRLRPPSLIGSPRPVRRGLDRGGLTSSTLTVGVAEGSILGDLDWARTISSGGAASDHRSRSTTLITPLRASYLDSRSTKSNSISHSSPPSRLT